MQWFWGAILKSLLAPEYREEKGEKRLERREEKKKIKATRSQAKGIQIHW